jgi:hypothetical protein
MSLQRVLCKIQFICKIYRCTFHIVPNHRVGRVLSFLSSRRNWDFPNPSPTGECAPPPPVLGGRAHWLAREGLGESQFRRGDIHCGTLYIYVLCVPNGVPHSSTPIYKKANKKRIRVMQQYKDAICSHGIICR